MLYIPLLVLGLCTIPLMMLFLSMETGVYMEVKKGTKRRLTILSAVLMGASGYTLAAEKPNILVIWGDDIGQSNISAYTFGLMGNWNVRWHELGIHCKLLQSY